MTLFFTIRIWGISTDRCLENLYFLAKIVPKFHALGRPHQVSSEKCVKMGRDTACGHLPGFPDQGSESNITLRLFSKKILYLSNKTSKY